MKGTSGLRIESPELGAQKCCSRLGHVSSQATWLQTYANPKIKQQTVYPNPQPISFTLKKPLNPLVSLGTAGFRGKAMSTPEAKRQEAMSAEGAEASPF